MNGSEIQKGKIREKEDIGREKVRQGDGECSGEKGYLCLSVVSTAGCLLKGSQVSYRVREKKKKGAAVWKMVDGTKSSKLLH